MPTGEGRIVESVPKVQASSSALHSNKSGPHSEVEEVRRTIDAENSSRVANMSDGERQQEVEELKERFGPGILELMRKRRAAREASHPSQVDFMSTSSADTPDVTMGESSSPSDSAQFKPSSPAKAVHFESSEPLRSVQSQGASSSTAGVVKDSTPTAASKGVRFDLDDATPEGLRNKYFPNAPADDPKLQWMQSGSSSAPPASSPLSNDADAPRFDLQGMPLTPEKAAELPTHLGLHHHGDQPHLAGYSLQEIIHLCYSTVPSQRISMMGVLGKVITLYTSPRDYEDAPWVQACKEIDVVKKGVDIACGILTGGVRSIGVFVGAVDLLFTALGGPRWQWMDGDVDSDSFNGRTAVAFHPDPTRDGEPTGVSSVPFEDLNPRLQEVLGLDSGAIPPGTLSQILRILHRAAVAVPAGADAVAPLLPAIIKSQVLRAPWPYDLNHPPNESALRLLIEVVVSSRTAAEGLSAQNVFEPLLKFISTEIPSAPAAQVIITEVLRIFYALGRYGLLASIATSARDVWQNLSRWVSQQVENSGGQASSLVIGYFDLLRIWTVCAVDPHRTTPEHDLTWAQASALQWVDEELSAIKSLIATKRYRELASPLSALAEYVLGATINGVRNGEEEKRYILDALREMDFVGQLPHGVDEMPFGDARTEYNAALAEVFCLHNGLRPVGNILESPERERLIWWFMATTQTSTVDVYLRHAALQASREDGVLDTAKWASSVFDLVLSCVPGDEPLALSLVDDLLRTDWSQVVWDTDHASAIPDLSKAIAAIGDSNGLQILRPLLHHSILPEIEQVLGPTRPSHLYLKATATLRPPAPEPDASGPGLPLPPDWAYSPLDELLSSGSSAAFALAPSDWDVSETQITRATLALALIQQTTSQSLNRSLTILNAMKVFMLEHGQQDAPNTDQDVFRDDTVHQLLGEVLAPICKPLVSGEDSPPKAEHLSSNESETKPPAPLEAASKRFLGSGVPFFQFYTDLMALYEAISFGDNLFSRVLLPPLAMEYAPDYRRLFWAEQPTALRSVRVNDDEVPLESCYGLHAFFAPLESDKEVLVAQARAVTGPVKQDTSPFLFNLACHHLAGLFWRGQDTERNSVRVQILIIILSTAPDNVVKHIFQHDLDTIRGTVSAEEGSLRARTAVELTGPRGGQRLHALGLVS